MFLFKKPKDAGISGISGTVRVKARVGYASCGTPPFCRSAGAMNSHIYRDGGQESIYAHRHPLGHT
jgi:hypothetical protein